LLQAQSQPNKLQHFTQIVDETRATMKTKIAIAGTGNVAKYLIEELAAYGHDVIVITRQAKPFITLPQRETDYTVDSLITVLEGCSALGSTVFDYNDMTRTTELQLSMLEACQRSATCKSFIPSEWTLNAEDYPEQPMLQAEHTAVLHKALANVPRDIRWTIISNSWFADYILPPRQRHLAEIGPAWPMDHASKTFTIYGPGTQVFDMVSVRDTAKAVALLLASDQPWNNFTYVSGQQLSWNELFVIIKNHDPEWTAINKPLAASIKQIFSEDPTTKFVGYFELLTYSGASLLPKERVLRDRKRYFEGIKFRNIDEILDDAATNQNQIV
jgi:swainsonine biosynthesis oxidoreductase SwnR